MYKLLIGMSLVLIVAGCSHSVTPSQAERIQEPVSLEMTGTAEQTAPAGEQKFLGDGLRTRTDKTLIDLGDVLDGGPGKDGIPSIDDPSFVAIDHESNVYLSDQSRGILVHLEETKRRYPYNILNWHEIVNDEMVVDGETVYLAVTFCPLCGSAIVFDRTVSGQLLEFGVSGKLRNSNLLMYDRTTESLWAQTLGKAVVGDMVGTKLDMVDASVISWDELRTHHPDAMVLSTDTGIPRDYNRSTPYAGYDTNDQLYFPVENLDDARLPMKTMLYAANISQNNSIAFVLESLRSTGSASLEVDGSKYTAYYEDAEYRIFGPDGNTLPGFFEMWFSWANKHEGSSYVWIE